MKQEIYKDKALSQLFSREKEIPVSDLLNKQIMCIAGATSLFMLAGVFIMLKYYLKVDFSMLFQGFTKKPDHFLLPDFFPVLFISLIVCSLLWIDHRIRKNGSGFNPNKEADVSGP